MPEFRFRYHKGQNRHISFSYGVTAHNPADAFKKMDRLVKLLNGRYIKGSMTVCGPDNRFRPLAQAKNYLQAAE